MRSSKVAVKGKGTMETWFLIREGKGVGNVVYYFLVIEPTNVEYKSALRVFPNGLGA